MSDRGANNCWYRRSKGSALLSTATRETHWTRRGGRWTLGLVSFAVSGPRIVQSVECWREGLTMHAQAVARPRALSVVAGLADEIDVNNAPQVGNDLFAAMRPGFGVVIADTTGTAYCDAMGIRCLLEASSRATA
jgi:hypothetical protein